MYAPWAYLCGVLFLESAALPQPEIKINLFRNDAIKKGYRERGEGATL